MLAFRDNIFANPEGLIAYIAKHPEGARVRPDMKVVFFDEWDTPPARLKGAAGILRTLVGIAEKGEGGVGVVLGVYPSMVMSAQLPETAE